MNRLQALYRGWGIPCPGNQVYAPHHRTEWLDKITEAGVRRRAEHYYQQLDALRLLRQEVRRDLWVESKKHQAWKLLGQVAGIGPIRAALLIALMQTPHRFRSKRQLWNYSGLGLETHDRGQYRAVEGQLQRWKKPVTLRGLNKDHNHELKDIFKGAAMRASIAAGPLHDFYEALLAKGRKPTMARLTLARKIAAITLIIGKKEVRFDANHLKQQAACAPLAESPFPPWEPFLAVAVGFLRRSDSRGSIHRSDQARAQNTRVSGTILCPFGQSHKAIGHESRIGSCVATHLSTGQPSGLYVSETNGVVTKGYGSTRERKRCSASGAETKRHTRLAEDRSRIEDARSNSWAECRENNFGIEPRGVFSLDIPFYRIDTSGARHSHSVLFGRSLTLQLAVVSLKKNW